MIELTSASTNNPIFINVKHIGHVYVNDRGTIVGVTTHNNGGFIVKESIDYIYNLLELHYSK